MFIFGRLEIFTRWLLIFFGSKCFIFEIWGTLLWIMMNWFLLWSTKISSFLLDKIVLINVLIELDWICCQWWIDSFFLKFVVNLLFNYELFMLVWFILFLNSLFLFGISQWDLSLWRQRVAMSWSKTFYQFIYRLFFKQLTDYSQRPRRTVNKLRKSKIIVIKIQRFQMLLFFKIQNFTKLKTIVCFRNTKLIFIFIRTAGIF